MIANVPQVLKFRLAREARDALGHDWTDKTLQNWLSPRCHTEARVEANREAVRLSSRRWRSENRDAVREADRRWRSENRDAVREADRRWRADNPDYRNDYQSRRYAEDPAFALARATRNRVNHALRAAVGSPGKARPTMELLGCSADELRVHLERLFQPGMTWDNWGEWHVDHVRPIASFDLSTEEGQRAAFHYTNTQPLWSKYNLAKGSLHDGVRHRY